MNPYAAALGDRDPLESLTATSKRLREQFDTLGPRGAELSLSAGKWTARQILCHLADTELVFAFRLRQTLAETHHVIQPFDQDAWATRYGHCEVNTALELFSVVRGWNVALIRSVAPEEYAKPLAHPERGEMTLKTLVETMAGHDLNHLRQLETISNRSASV